MVKEIRIYFEGHPGLRAGFHKFLGSVIEAARERRCRLELVASEGKPVGDFMKALRKHPDAFNVLLLDSERPDSSLLFQELQRRDDWRPAGPVSIDQVHWMIELMESWFLADRNALSRFYGQGFREAALPGNPDVEKIPKIDVLSGLKSATAQSRKGAYKKGAHAPKILEAVNPAAVRRAAPGCERLFADLGSRLG